MLRRSLFLSICGIIGLLVANANTDLAYRLPDIPDSLITPEERGDYLIEHYWDNFEVENRSSVGQQEVVEEVFADYVTLMRIASRESTVKSIERLLSRAGNDEDILLMYVGLAEHYLYSGEGDFVSEEAYIPFVKTLLNSKKVSKLKKMRYAYQYDVLTQNQPGMVVTDFEYKLPGKDKPMRVKKLKTPFVLLYVNDPDCDDCSLATLRLSVSQALLNAIREGRLTVLSVYPDGENEEWLSQVATYPREWVVASMEEGDRLFDLRVMPVVYLLDKDKKIVLKNPSLEELENYLKER